MLQRGTQPTAPSRQVHWYLQLLWKDSPLRYTMPLNTHGAPSRAARGRRQRVSRAGGSLGGSHFPRSLPGGTLSLSPRRAAAPAPTHRCRRRFCGWRGSRNRRRAPCGGRRGRARCTARPAAWRRRGSSHSRRAPGRRRRGRWGQALRRTGTARCTPGLEPPASAGERGEGGGVRAAAGTARTRQARRRRGRQHLPG